MKRQRSVRELSFLCGIMLAASAPPSLAQEAGESAATDLPVTRPGAEARNLEAERSLGVESVETEPDASRPEMTAEGLDAEEIDEETLAAGQSALDAAARLEAQIMLADLLDEELYDEAVVVAERIVELTEAERGESVDLGIVLSNLAIVQRRAELYEESEANFVRAIETIRAVDGNFSDAVINPLVGLGINFQQRGEPMQAITIFEEARTVNRRAYGLMNEEQIDILDHMSSVMIDLQRYAEADRLQLDALQLRERIYGAESMEILPAIYKFAGWLR
ncbi:MAG: tetratricopeptide repeat protein, partial [Gammaproteobacteria bacterium]